MRNDTKTPRGHGFGAEDIQAIRQFMKDLDWTQERLANESGLSLPTIKLFLTGKRKLSAPASDRVIEALRAGHIAKNAADASRPRLSPESAERIRAKANALLSEAEAKAPVTPPLTFEQAEQMPFGEVVRIVTSEIYASMALLFALNTSASPEERDAMFKATVEADPRVKYAEIKFRLDAAETWIKRVEKERDDLKGELLKANQELLETYRRIAALEKDQKA